LTKQVLPNQVSLVLAADDLNSDIHASAEYRAHLCGVMLKQALATLA
jgi:carbon-monoxide dehydrogenase medium subunit